MSNKPKSEPSQWALGLLDRIQGVPDYRRHQAELKEAARQIDAACAAKDAEIARLKEHAAGDAMDVRLKAAGELAPAQERIAELTDAYQRAMTIGLKQKERIAAMAALMERVPHESPELGRWGLDVCAQNCAACAWEKLKATPCSS